MQVYKRKLFWARNNIAAVDGRGNHRMRDGTAGRIFKLKNLEFELELANLEPGKYVAASGVAAFIKWPRLDRDDFPGYQLDITDHRFFGVRTFTYYDAGGQIPKAYRVHAIGANVDTETDLYFVVWVTQYNSNGSLGLNYTLMGKFAETDDVN